MSRTDSPDEAPEEGQTRRERLAARRRKRTRFAVASFIVVALVAAGFGAYAYTNTDNSAKAVDIRPGAKSTTTLPDAAFEGDSQTLRALDHAHPLRLWIGGDSLAGSFGPALGDAVGATGVVQTVIDYKVSSGLWSNDPRDWTQRATAQMSSANPEAVVFIIGTNDTPMVNNTDANGDGVPDWEPLYRTKVDHMMDTLVGPTHRTVFWLGAPTLGTNQNDAAVEVNRVMKEEAAKRAPDVVYIDTYRMFEGPDGGYSRSITDENGKQIVARISDGVHFTEDGAAYLGRAVFKFLDARWHLHQQADTADPIGWTFVPGSVDAVPGYTSTPRSRYRSNYHSGSNGSGSNSSPDTSGTPGTSGTPQTTPETTPHETTPHSSPTPSTKG
jgi:hypothetical protein